jgi:signal transduction histidine kinase/DNA-binding NarL/FixJ family response regulator
MAAREPYQHAQSQEHNQLARLDRFLVVDFAVSVLGCMTPLLLAFVFPAARGPILFLAGMTAVYAALVLVARAMAHRGYVSRCILVVCAGHWTIVILLSIITPMLFPVQAMLALVPVAFALPYVTRQTLMPIIAVSVVVSFVVALVSALMPDWLHLSEVLPAALFATFLVFFVPTISGILFLLMWQHGARLSDTLHETLLAYSSALKSRQELEARVQQRTAELQARTEELERNTRTLEEREVELADARDEALSASRAKSDFLANVSHELRGPLTTIIGYSEMHLEDDSTTGGGSLVEPETVRGDLGKILKAGRHLLELVNELLQSAQPELTLDLEDFEVARLLQDVASMMQPHAARNANIFEVSCGPVGWMHADRRKVYQALLNLVGNACKFTRNGVVRLTVTRDADAAQIRFDVSDTGIGVQPEHLKDLFQQFGSAARSTSRRYGGAGLGLHLSRQFCDAMGGRIEVSSSPGQGSTFTLLIPAEVQPRSQPSATPERPETSVAAETTLSTRELEVANLIARGLTNREVADALVMTEGTAERHVAGIRTKLAAASPSRVANWLSAQWPGSGNVLLIDDDQAVRDRLLPLVSREGLRLMYAETGEVGLQMARARRPDAILLDVLLPGIDGWSVLQSLKSDAGLADVPVIMLTIVDDRRRGLSLGASDYLSKPVDREQFAVTMRKFRRPLQLQENSSR